MPSMLSTDPKPYTLLEAIGIEWNGGPRNTGMQPSRTANPNSTDDCRSPGAKIAQYFDRPMISRLRFRASTPSEWSPAVPTQRPSSVVSITTCELSLVLKLSRSRSHDFCSRPSMDSKKIVFGDLERCL